MGRRYTPTIANVLSRSAAKDGRAQRGGIDGSPGREIRPRRALALQHGVLVQLRVTGGQTF
eukprot:4045590-Alexandrium_andersonii.AAC.1